MNTKKDCCEKPVFCRCMEHGGKCHNCGKQRFQDEVVIVPSGRIDWCGDCQAEHGYECPKDSHTDSTKKCPLEECDRDATVIHTYLCVEG